MDSKTPDNGSGLELAESSESDAPNTQECAKRSASIHQRLFEAHCIVGGLEKSDKAVIKKDGRTVGSYDYHSHDNVTAKAKDALVRVRVLAWPTMLEMSQGGNRTRVDVNLKFINIDDPSDFIESVAFAYGCDNQDKGPGKAYSYAVKNALLKGLMINTGDDIEAHNVEYDEGSSSAVVEAEKKVSETMEAWATTFKSALTSAPTLDAVKELEKANKGRLTSAELPAVTRSFFVELIEKRKGEVA